MNHFLALLDKLAQRPSHCDARVRVFKLESNPVPLENSPAPERLPVEPVHAKEAGRPAFGRKRRPKP